MAAGASFVGPEGKIRIGNNTVDSNPPELVAEAAKDLKVRLPEIDNHMQNWFDAIKSRGRPICDVRSATARRSSATWATSPAGSAAVEMDPRRRPFRATGRRIVIPIARGGRVRAAGGVSQAERARRCSD